MNKKNAAKERLERNLKSLEYYCQRPVDWLAEVDDGAENPIGEWLDKRRVLWPSHELLWEINDDVIVLAGRKKRILPGWKAYEQVDRRIRKLRLKSSLNDLIRRALNMIAGESELAKAARELEAGSARAQCLVRDIFEGTRSLRQLLDEDRKRMEWKAKCYPLVEWLMVIGHPKGKEFGPVVDHYAVDDAAVKEWKLLEHREKQRARTRRYRAQKKPLKRRYTV